MAYLSKTKAFGYNSGTCTVAKHALRRTTTDNAPTATTKSPSNAACSVAESFSTKVMRPASDIAKHAHEPSMTVTDGTVTSCCNSSVPA